MLSIIYMMGLVYNEDKQINIIKGIIDDEYNKFINNKNEELCKEVPPLLFSYTLKINFVEDTGEKDTYESKPRYTKLILKQKSFKLINSIYYRLLMVAPLLKNPYWAGEDVTRLAFIRMLEDDGLEDIKIDEKERYYLDFEFISQ